MTLFLASGPYNHIKKRRTLKGRFTGGWFSCFESGFSLFGATLEGSFSNCNYFHEVSCRIWAARGLKRTNPGSKVSNRSRTRCSLSEALVILRNFSFDLRHYLVVQGCNSYGTEGPCADR